MKTHAIAARPRTALTPALAFVAAMPGLALAHPGHGAGPAHLHLEVIGALLLAVAVIAAFLLRRRSLRAGRRRRD